MKRMKVLFGQRRMMVLATLAILVLAAAALAASSASFTATSANPGNMFTAGTLSMDNDHADAVIWDIADLKPGDTDVYLGSVTVGNAGSTPGDFQYSATNIHDDLGANGGNLSEVLYVRVLEGGATLYYGLLTDFADGSQRALGLWNGGDSHTYDFQVTWPDGGVPASATTGDNAYQGSACTVDIYWSSTSN